MIKPPVEAKTPVDNTSQTSQDLIPALENLTLDDDIEWIYEDPTSDDILALIKPPDTKRHHIIKFIEQARALFADRELKQRIQVAHILCCLGCAFDDPQELVGELFCYFELHQTGCGSEPPDLLNLPACPICDDVSPELVASIIKRFPEFRINGPIAYSPQYLQNPKKVRIGTPWHAAANIGSKPVLDTLWLAGANTKAVDQDGYTGKQIDQLYINIQYYAGKI